MPSTDSFALMIASLRSGDQEAARTVFQRYARSLIALARARLGDRIAHKDDPEDVLQSVFRSFFLRFQDGQFEVEGWDHLWGLLVVITLRKCDDRIAYFHTARRDINREVPRESPSPDVAGWEAPSREPTPEEAAVLTETIELLMRRLEPRDREILTCHLQGYSAAEIANRVCRARRTVRRTLERIENILKRVQAGEEIL